MKLYTHFSRIVLFCLGLFMLFLISPQSVNASEPMEIVVKHEVGGKGVKDVTFELYRVGDIAEDGTITLTGAFKDYPVYIDQSDSASWKSAAAVMTGYAYFDEVTPLQVEKTDEDGKVVLDANGAMTEGLYLVAGLPYTRNEVNYHTQPFLVAMPAKVNGEEQYSIEIDPKYEEIHGVSDVTVIKVWKDITEEDRMFELTATILDSATKEVLDSAVLNEANNWRYTFRNLPLDKSWYLIEHTVSADYKLTVEHDVHFVIMTNTHVAFLVPDTPIEPEKPIEPGTPDEPEDPNEPGKPGEPEDPNEPGTPDGPEDPNEPGTPDEPEDPNEPGTPDEPEDPNEPGTPGEPEDPNEPGTPDEPEDPNEPGTPGEPEEPNEPGTPDDPDKPGKPDEPKLPQTGVLWWPVPILAAAGLVFLLIGLAWRRKYD